MRRPRYRSFHVARFACETNDHHIRNTKNSTDGIALRGEWDTSSAPHYQATTRIKYNTGTAHSTNKVGPPLRVRIATNYTFVPGIQADRDHIDNMVGVRNNREVHPDGVVYPPTRSLIQRDDGPRSLFEVVQGVRDGGVLPNTKKARVKTMNCSGAAHPCSWIFVLFVGQSP